MASELTDLILRLNLTLAGAILLVLMARKPLRRIAGARVAYALWLLPPLAAVVVFLPTRMAPAPLDRFDAVLGPVEVTSPPPPPLVTPEALLGLWATGLVLGVALVAWRHGRFMGALGVLRRRWDGVLQADADLVGPAVVGVIAPRIVLPADFEQRFSPEEQTVVLAHEARHLEAGHAQLNALAVLGQCLCWFNPLVHLAAHLFRIDQELACDAAVIGRHPDRRRTYAEAMLKTQLARADLALGCYWPSRAAHPLCERIEMLNRRAPGRVRRALGALLLAVLALGGGYGAWAAQPKRYVVPQPLSAAPAPEAVVATPIVATIKPRHANARRERVAMAVTPPAASAAPAATAPPEGEAKRSERGFFVTQWVGGRVPEAPIAPQPPPPPGSPLDQPARYDPYDRIRNPSPGAVRVTCTIREDGGLENCNVAPQDRADARNAERALALAPKLRLNPIGPDGRSLAGTEVSFSYRFAAGVAEK